jgi:molecular chaperone DnaJ
MRSENLYSTLGVDTNATPEEIRKAYRRLAMKYHPDKNNGDAVSALRFKDIHHAYQVLSDPHRRSAYNQKRWFYKHAVTRETQPLTPYHFFTRTNELERFLDKLRPSEINKKALSLYIKHLLSEPSLQMLKTAADAPVNKEVITHLLKATAFLSGRQTKSIVLKLRRIADAETLPLIDRRMKEIRLQVIWERYHVLIVMLMATLLCVMAYLVSK